MLNVHLMTDGQKLLRDGNRQKIEKKEDQKQGGEMKLPNTPESYGEEKLKNEIHGKLWGNPLFDAKLNTNK